MTFIRNLKQYVIAAWKAFIATLARLFSWPSLYYPKYPEAISPTHSKDTDFVDLLPEPHRSVIRKAQRNQRYL